MTGDRVRTELYHLYLGLANTLLACPLHRVRLFTLEHLCRYVVGSNVTVGRSIRVLSKGGVWIGDRCVLNRGVTLDGRGGLHIGDDVDIAPEVALLTAFHDPDSPSHAGIESPVRVGDRCWLATRVIILPGVTLGTGVAVAAGAVVASDVPAHTLVGGVPARRLRDRAPEAQARMKQRPPWFV